MSVTRGIHPINGPLKRAAALFVLFTMLFPLTVPAFALLIGVVDVESMR